MAVTHSIRRNRKPHTACKLVSMFYRTGATADVIGIFYLFALVTLILTRWASNTNLTLIPWPHRYTGCAKMNFNRLSLRHKAFESYRLTDWYTDYRHDRNYTPRRWSTTAMTTTPTTMSVKMTKIQPEERDSSLQVLWFSPIRKKRTFNADPKTSSVSQQCSYYPQTYTYIINAVPLIYVVSNHVDTDKLTTANGGTFTSSSASRSSQSC